MLPLTELVELSQKLAEKTASACSTCRSNDPPWPIAPLPAPFPKVGGQCCRSCKQREGHFRIYSGEITKEKHEELKQRYGFYSNPNGFLGPRGCVLPRYRRSTICLAYYCYREKLRKLLPNDEFDILIHLMYKVDREYAKNTR